MWCCGGCSEAANIFLVYLAVLIVYKDKKGNDNFKFFLKNLIEIEIYFFYVLYCIEMYWGVVRFEKADTHRKILGLFSDLPRFQERSGGAGIIRFS